MNPLIKRKGGKFYAKNQILKHFPASINTYIEPFLGGGSIFLNLENQHICVKTACFLNDASPDIFRLWKVFFDPDLKTELLTMLRSYAIYDESVFAYLKNLQPRTEVEAAFRLIMLTHASYQGACESYYIGIGDVNRKMNKLYKPADFWDIYHQYLIRMNAKISQRDFSIFFQGAFNRQQSFIYADPPYFGTSGYDDLPFDEKQHTQLCDLAHQFKGKLIISLNDVDWVRKNYADFRLEPIKTRWAGNVSSQLSKSVHECLLMNF